jgi:ligand-binding SRPBCC domain-containing protein
VLCFEHSSCIAAPPEHVFSFHEQPGAFEALTPPWERVAVVSGKGRIEAGAEVVLRLRVGPCSKTWAARYTAYVKDRLFVNEQVRGPFRSWRHEQRFEPQDG